MILLYRTAHAMKSACTYLGARELKELCATIERDANEGLDCTAPVGILAGALERFQVTLPRRLKLPA